MVRNTCKAWVFKMKIVCLASGGIDSTLMMYLLSQDDHEVFPLFINYGQLSIEKEKESYNKICNFLNLTPKIIDISNYGLSIKSGITNDELDVYKDAFLPNRNLLFLLVGSSYAYQNDVYAVSIGLILNPIFPDQTITFLEKAEACFKESLEVDIKILAPIIDLSKEEIYNLAQFHKIPIEDTYYCHTGKDVPCGVCIACQEHIGLTKSATKGDS